VREKLESTYVGKKGEIYLCEETTVKAAGRGGEGVWWYGPRGSTPVVNRSEKKEHISMVSAITNQGKVYWKLHEGSINREKFLDFEKRLISNKRHKIFLILDNTNPHHSKILKEWAEKNKEGIEVWYLPSIVLMSISIRM
jgi:hypothetical protein